MVTCLGTLILISIPVTIALLIVQKRAAIDAEEYDA